MLFNTVLNSKAAKKINNWSRSAGMLITSKRIFFLLCPVTVAMVALLFIIAKYNFPSADDFVFSLGARDIWNETHSFWQVLKAAGAKTAETYQDWQGSFAAVFIMCLQPSLFGIEYYSLVPYFTLLLLVVSTVYFGYTVLVNALKTNKWQAGCIICTVIIIFTQFLPSAVQGFYWFNGATYYTLFFSLALIMIALLVNVSLTGNKIKKVIYTVAASLLGVLIGGGNYSTALTTALVITVFIAYNAQRKNKIWFLYTPPLLFLMSAFVISMAAPGNSIRQVAFTGNSFVDTIFLCFKYAVKTTYEYTTIPVLALLLFITPFLWVGAQKSSLSFRLPVLLTFLSVCLYAAGFAPALYAMGYIGPPRLTNVYYFSCIILLAVNIYYWLGWVNKKTATFKSAGTGFDTTVTMAVKKYALAGVSAILLLLVAGTVYMGITRTMSSYVALRSLAGGEAKGYYNEMMERIRVLKDTSVPDVEFYPLEYQPYLLLNGDLDYDPTYFANGGMAMYFGKSSVKLVPRE